MIDAGRTCLVVTTDPVTLTTPRIGWYAVHVNANDVAVMGARPRWFFAVLLLPAGQTTNQTAESIMREIARACSEVGATVCGGHTEITDAVSQPVVVGQMLGEVPRSRLVRKDALQPGDDIVMTGWAGIEGTAILAREYRTRLARRVPARVVARARRMLDNPGISVVGAALRAARVQGVHSMHDPTEGGVLAGLYEMATAAGRGLRADADRIPIRPETAAICRVLGVDPLALIASGSLLIGIRGTRTHALLSALRRARIPATVIARVEPQRAGVTLVRAGRPQPLLPPARDELARLADERTRRS